MDTSTMHGIREAVLTEQSLKTSWIDKYHRGGQYWGLLPVTLPPQARDG